MGTNGYIVMGGEFVRFFLVGVGATLVHLFVYWSLNELLNVSEDTPVTLTLSYSVGYVVSFVFNYIVSLKWTFRTKGSVKKGMGFAFSHAVNACMQLLLLHVFRAIGIGGTLVALMRNLFPLLVEWWPVLGQSESLLPFPVYMIVVPMNFLMVRYFLRK